MLVCILVYDFFHVFIFYICTLSIFLVIKTLVIALLQYFFCYLFCLRNDRLNPCYCHLVSNWALLYQISIKSMSLNLQSGWTLAKGPLSLDYDRKVLNHYNCIKVYSHIYHLYSHDRFITKTIYDHTLAQKSLSRGSWKLQFFVDASLLISTIIQFCLYTNG